MPGQASSERPTKRSRVSRACDQCRTAREKCDGTQPACLTCSASKRSCTYTSAPKKRGIQPGYIRTLELALTWLFQNTDSEALLNRKIAQEGITSVLFGRETKDSNRLHKSWRRSKFCRDVDKLLSGEQVGDDQTPKSDGDDSEVETDVAPTQKQSSLPPPEDGLSPTAPFTSLALTRQHIPPGNAPETDRTPSHSLSQSPTTLPPSSWRLMDIYFAYTQSWLPICEKHDVLRISYSYPDHGIPLSATDFSDSGDHAELWSILAVATVQAKADAHETDELPDTEELYGIARGLIPDELNSFTSGHVKALLNLAVINMGRNKAEAAWLLVGLASRILKVVERSATTPIPRLKHLRAGCFMLDGFLSNQLGSACLQRCDIASVEENGLEEWQPWANPIHSVSVPPSRTPVLGLSSFNKLLVLTDIRISLTEGPDATQPQLSRLDQWKTSLPATLQHVFDERKQTPLNPPALLLQMTYLCTLFSLCPSETLLSHILDSIERYSQQLGVSALPPPINCLLSPICNHYPYATTEQRLLNRLQQISEGITRAWSASTTYQVPTPESIHVSFNPPFTPATNRPPSQRQRPSTLIDDLLPDMNSGTVAHRPSTSMSTGMANFNVPPVEDEFRRSSLQSHPSISNPMVPPDLENFFDELASLDGAEKLHSQPQFMENLGFAPDANMADFLAAEFGQFIPASSSTFLPQNHDDPTHLDPAFFGTT
ncbi:hypothetical protein P280DRAFT_443652 [Massarina eburnea CBS 473.64]|uniref:Zn(2)-C6 fungal-type domain-containing protein n=1 Tax=Massarina eburnea CBS 473.64 TaxID=1395130 RepID=A0A6A6SBY9_9PLEO|nr:hypothetical protein P280DRAFT_443652 [Massarina eburnea CBS 473.64]